MLFYEISLDHVDSLQELSLLSSEVEGLGVLISSLVEEKRYGEYFTPRIYQWTEGQKALTGDVAQAVSRLRVSIGAASRGLAVDIASYREALDAAKAEAAAALAAAASSEAEEA